MENIEEKKYVYDAFISYRHTEPDKFVAENLHKMMESFKPPKSILSKENTRKKIERVFRDRDELPLASNLEDPIVEALEKSEYLIVICSPRLRESIWCKREIETFIEMHGRRNVLAVLVEGEPEDSFPEELLYENVETTDENGQIHVEKRPIEPLAADCRGKNNKEIKKAIKSEMLRLLAPMFNVGYDDLKQRHREQRIKRIATLCTVISGLAVIFSAYIALSALKIRDQALEIASQAEQLAENQAGFLAQEALDYHNNDDRLNAVISAYCALDTYAGVTMPETAEAKRALAEAIRVYDGGYYINPSDYVETDFAPEDMKVSPDGSKLLVKDKSGVLTMWDLDSEEKIYDVSCDYSVTGFDFADDETFFYTDFSDGLVFASVADGKSVSGKWNDNRIGQCIDAVVSDDRTILAVRNVETILFYQLSDGTFLSEVKPADGDFRDVCIVGDTAYIVGIAGGYVNGRTTLTAVKVDDGSVLYNNEYEQGLGISIDYTEGEGKKALLLSGGFTKILVDATTGEYITHHVIEDGVALVKPTDSGDFLIYTEDGISYLLDPSEPNELNGIKYINCNDVKKFAFGATRLVGIRNNDSRLVFYTYFKNIDSQVYSDEVEGPSIEAVVEDDAKEWAKSKGIERPNAVSAYVELPDVNIAVVSMIDGSISTYSLEDMSLLNVSKENAFMSKGYYGKFGDYYLVDFSVEDQGPTAFAFDEEGKICATIPSFAGVTKDRDRVVVYGRDDDRKPANISLPIYDKKALTEKAERFLSR